MIYLISGGMEPGPTLTDATAAHFVVVVKMSTTYFQVVSKYNGFTSTYFVPESARTLILQLVEIVSTTQDVYVCDDEFSVTDAVVATKAIDNISDDNAHATVVYEVNEKLVNLKIDGYKRNQTILQAVCDFWRDEEWY